MSPFKIAVLILSLTLVTCFTFAQKVVEPANPPTDWTKACQPFRIAGNLYYVGTYDLACYLITTSQGNILINTGLASSASMIKSNIEALGFKFNDTKILLTTQAHYDHMGAMAAIRKMTGAKIMIDEKDADVAADGGKSDYALGSTESSYEPVKADQLLRDGDVIKLGDADLTMLHHPGHTKGSCSFVLNTKDKTNSYRVLIANLPTIVTDKKFSELSAYPDVATDYAYSFASLKKQQFDIWVASHASQFNLHTKHKPGDAYNPASFVDRKGFDAAVESLESAYKKKISGN